MDFKFTVEKREKGQNSKKLFAQGFIAANVYGKDVPSFSVKVPYHQFLKCWHKKPKSVELVFAGKTYTAGIEEVQWDNIGKHIHHISFFAFDAKKEQTMCLPFVVKGEARGVKEGGVLHRPHHEITVTGMLSDFPECFEYDVSTMNIGDSLKLSQIVSDYPKLKFHPSELDYVLVSCAHGKVEPISTQEKVETNPEAEAASSVDKEAA